jgi:methylisocitrate lyase
MKKTTRLRKLIEDPKILVMPGVYDVITATLAVEAGFDSVQISGANVGVAHYGVPDYSLVGMREMVEQSGRIANAIDVPAMGDADTGYGNAVNAYLTVQAFENAGVAGVNLEDQVIPKRCGHLEGKVLLPFDDAVAKVAAACDARRDKDFVINARTDALGVLGIEEAIRRGNAFLDAGATMVFVEGANSVENIRAAVAGIRGPVAVNLVEGGKSPQNMTFAELACHPAPCRPPSRRCARFTPRSASRAASAAMATCWPASASRSGWWALPTFSNWRRNISPGWWTSQVERRHCIGYQTVVTADFSIKREFSLTPCPAKPSRRRSGTSTPSRNSPPACRCCTSTAYSCTRRPAAAC